MHVLYEKILALVNIGISVVTSLIIGGLKTVGLVSAKGGKKHRKEAPELTVANFRSSKTHFIF